MARKPFRRVTILVVNTVPVAVEHEADGMVYFDFGGPAKSNAVAGVLERWDVRKVEKGNGKLYKKECKRRSTDMSTFCTNCGTQVPDGSLFCPNCGNAVGQRMPQSQMHPQSEQPPHTTPQDAPPDVTMVTPNIGRGPDGKYRWIYEVNLFRNLTLFLTVWKIFFFVSIGLFVMMTVIRAAEGDLDGKAALDMLGICGIVLGVVTALVVISFLIYAGIMGGKYIAMFEMDEDGIMHRQLPKQAKRAMGIASAAFAIGMLSNSVPAMASGFAASNTEMYTSFSKTKKVHFYPRSDTIKIRHTLKHNQVYAKPEDFSFVQNYILGRVPDSAKPNM